MTGSEQGQEAAKVLVVEDDESTALYVTRVLRRHGLSTDWVVDAEQASLRLQDEPFDILLADYRLPGRSGMELTAETRRLFPGMGIAVMTSVGGRKTEEAARASGADDVFEKPLHSDELVRRITVLVCRAQASRRGSKGAPPAKSVARTASVVTVPADSSVDEQGEAPGNAGSGPGEQAPLKGGALAWRDTDRTSGSGGPCGEGTGGISRVRCSALLEFQGRGFSCPGAGGEPAGAEPAGTEPAGAEPAGSEPAGAEVAGLSEGDIRARASHPSGWRRSRRRATFVMWASAAPAVSVGPTICALTSPQLHTSPSC